MEDMNKFIPHNQRQSCRCPGDARCQAISSFGIDPFLQENWKFSNQIEWYLFGFQCRCKCLFFTPWPFRPNRYCRCLCLSICLSVHKLFLCGYDNYNLSHIWAGITKFAPNMHHGIFSVAIENCGHWPWSSRTFWLWILGNLACLHHISSQIWGRITIKKCILGYFQLVFKMGVIDLDLQGDFGHFTLEF